VDYFGRRKLAFVAGGTDTLRGSRSREGERERVFIFDRKTLSFSSDKDWLRRLEREIGIEISSP